MSRLRATRRWIANLLRSTRPTVSKIVLNPWTYLLLYFGVIFSFAGLYTAREDAVFYAPYAKYEAPSRRDYSAVEANIIDSVTKADSFNRVDDTGWILNPDSFEVTELAVDDKGDFSFTLSLYASHFTHLKKDLVLAGPIENLRVSRRLNITTDPKTNAEVFCRFVTLPPDQDRRPLLEALFKQSIFGPTYTLLGWAGRISLPSNRRRWRRECQSLLRIVWPDALS